MDEQSEPGTAPNTAPVSPQDSHLHPGTGNNGLPKLPPCDQCRRRKVKCQQTSEGPCDRCVQSALTCTRDIQRKKRGPKKGSGSVIAKLRGESETAKAQEAGLPPFNLSSLDMQLPGLRNRALSNESATSSPLGSPLSSHFGDAYGPTSNPLSNMPRSVPLGFGDEISPLPTGSFGQAGISFPPSWAISEDQPLLQYPSPASANGYLTVNDLAQQIFQEPMGMSDNSLYANSSLGPTIHRPGSIDAVLTGTAPTTAASPTGTNASSPRPAVGPKYLYRSNSGQGPAEQQLLALASEMGLSAYLLSQCVKQFFRHLYPIWPILHQASFAELLNQQEELSTQDKILVLSLCACTVTHAAPPSDLSLQNKQDFGRELLKQCLHLRHTYEWIENATLQTIISSFFISVTYFELKQVRSHHFFLREAIGLAREMHSDTEKATSDPVETILRTRMLALLFITERGCAILRNKPISMMRLSNLPSGFFSEDDEKVLSGFSALCTLFSLLDEKFVELWYATSVEDEPPIPINSSPLENVAAIQQSLNDTSFNKTSMTDIQKADVLITHQWLRLIFWQASMRQGLITSNSSEPMFSYSYPIIIAKDLCKHMQAMEYEAILVHGLGIFEKVFEVAYTLMDALTLQKNDWNTSEDLKFLFRCLSASPNSHNTYVKVLENKISIEKAAGSSSARNVGQPTSAAQSQSPLSAMSAMS